MSNACRNTTPNFDYTDLTRLIINKYGKANFARLMSMRLSHLESLLSGENEFTQTEIIRAAALLDIRANEVASHFFYIKSLENINN